MIIISNLNKIHLFQWKRLLDPAVWLDAATQIFYSFGLAFGCLIALASYNPVRSNFVKEALFVSIVDFFTSIFTAVVVFSILGESNFVIAFYLICTMSSGTEYGL